MTIQSNNLSLDGRQLTERSAGFSPVHSRNPCHHADFPEPPPDWSFWSPLKPRRGGTSIKPRSSHSVLFVFSGAAPGQVDAHNQIRIRKRFRPVRTPHNRAAENKKNKFARRCGYR